MHYVELDMNNLKRWLSGTIGTSGGNAQNENGNGFIVYFSDRRNNKNPNAGVGVGKCGAIAAPCETGEYGWENMVNLADANGNTLTDFDPGEDVNGNGVVQDVYGETAVQRAGRRARSVRHRRAGHGQSHARERTRRSSRAPTASSISAAR